MRRKHATYQRSEWWVNPTGITGPIGATLIDRSPLGQMDTDPVAQGTTYAEIKAGDVDTSVLDLTSARFRYRTTRGGRGGFNVGRRGRRRGGVSGCGG